MAPRPAPGLGQLSFNAGLSCRHLPMTNWHPAIIAREFDLLSNMLEEWNNELLLQDDGNELDHDQLKARLDRFAEQADKALPRIEWLLLNAGECMTPEQRYQVARIRGEFLNICNWQEAL